MKTCTKCKDQKPIAAFHKDAASCKVCRNAQIAVYEGNNTEKIKIRKAVYYIANKPHRNSTTQAYYSANKAAANAASAAHYIVNIEKAKTDHAKYRVEHPAIMTALCARYRSRKLHATPSWANLNRIKCYYSVASMLNKEGIDKWQVDHIIPLQGKLVCGLHVENNLQILTSTQNRKKGNKHVS